MTTASDQIQLDYVHLKFDDVPGFQVANDAVRHLTRFATPPPAGTVVETLCGALHEMPLRPPRRPPEPRFDCTFCQLEYLGLDP